MSRPIHFAHEFTDGERVVFKTGMAGSKCGFICRGIICCNPVICCKADDIIKSSYIKVYENKLEYNYPTYDCCCSEVDSVSTVYFDRDLATNADKAGCCTPWCTHNMCCPTCFDCCGEALVLHGDPKCGLTRCCNPDKIALTTNPIENCGMCCLNKPHIMLTSLKNSKELALQIKMAVANARMRIHKNQKPVPPPQAGPPMQQMMMMAPPPVTVNINAPQPVSPMAQAIGNPHA